MRGQVLEKRPSWNYRPKDYSNLYPQLVSLFCGWAGSVREYKVISVRGYGWINQQSALKKSHDTDHVHKLDFIKDSELTVLGASKAAAGTRPTSGAGRGGAP